MTLTDRFRALTGVACLAAASTVVVAGPSGVAAGAAVPTCRPSQVRITTGVAEGAAGTIYVPLVFTNRGTTCTIWGVPSVQAVTPTHRPVGPPARNDSIGQMPALHVLRRGQSVASALGVVETGNYPVDRCHARHAWGVRVRLGSLAGPAFVKLGISVCTSRASTSVRLVVAGRTGVATS
ncbi:MAG: DUF4232 domain-containing protein [Acidimicrobiales bacterium]